VADIVFVTEDLRETELLKQLERVERERLAALSKAQASSNSSGLKYKIVHIMKDYKRLKYQYAALQREKMY